MHRRSIRFYSLVAALAVTVAACGVAAASQNEAAPAEVSATALAADTSAASPSDAPTAVAAPDSAAEVASLRADAVHPARGGMDASELTELADATNVAPAAASVVTGAGVTTEVLADALSGVVAAEVAMSDFEVAWDAGMTYSETFRGWRAINKQVNAAFADFSMPAEISADQVDAVDEYLGTVAQAQVKWQEVTDFIVTYITNYTSERLIDKSYRDVEVELRAALALRSELLDS